MAPPLYLPPELWAIVCSRLDQQMLSALSKTCKAWRTMIEPIIYRKIVMITDNATFPNEHKHDALHRLLRTILCRPDLSSLIREFRHTGPRCKRYRRHHRSCFSKREQALAKVALAAMELAESPGVQSGYKSEHDRWMVEILDYGHAGAVLGLILLQLTSLEVLSLEFEQDSRYSAAGIGNELLPLPFVGAALLTSIDARLPLSKTLHTVSYSVLATSDRDEVNTTLDLREFACLFYLPNVTHISIKYAGQESFTWPRDRPIARKLEWLNFQHTRINLDSLEEWIKASPNLCSFNYHTVTDCASKLGTWLDCTRLAEILLPLQSKLEYLHISTRCSLDGLSIRRIEPSWGTFGQLAPLTMFTKLVSLMVPLTALFSSGVASGNRIGHALPPSLRYMSLMEDVIDLEIPGWVTENAVQEICDWVAECFETTPLLENLEFTGSYKQSEIYVKLVETVCESVGLEFIRSSTY